MPKQRKQRQDPNFYYARNLTRKALARQLDEFLEGFDQNQPIQLNSNYFIRPLLDIYVNVGIKAATKEYNLQEKAFLSVIDFLQEGWRKSILDYSRDYAYRISNKLTLTTKRAIQRVILGAKEDKLNNTQLSALIRDHVNGINEARANNIARTESTTASNFGKFVGAETQFKKMDTKGYKYWVHGRSKSPRHSHLAVAKNKPIPIDKDFVVNGEKMRFAGDTNATAKNRCNCTCTVNYMSAELYARRYGQ